MREDPDLARISKGSPGEVLSVSALVRSVHDVLEHRFPLLWVSGEISNLTIARSGHAYFLLKDASAQVRCVMFRHRLQFLDWSPQEGMKVDAQALVTLYEPRGEFQLNLETMRRAGLGALFEAFVRLRERLEREGLFDEALKRPLPAYPRSIGIVTSPAAAALRDVLSTFARRNPSISLTVYPTPVQGSGAAASIAQAIAVAGARSECEALIVVRGGGSIEDLWAFNEEVVARALRACPIPVVTGIGHETDFTIADFAADRRAHTPTAAAELLSPPRAATLERVSDLRRRLSARAMRDIETRMQLLDHLARRIVHPATRLAVQAERFANLGGRLSEAIRRALEQNSWAAASLRQRIRTAQPRIEAGEHALSVAARRLAAAASVVLERTELRCAALAESLRHLSPQRVLERGYSVVRDERGTIVRDAARVSPGDLIGVTFARGQANARVERTD